MGHRLAGKVIVVTGSTQGIGKGIGMMCASEGAHVVFNGIVEQDGARAVREVQEKGLPEAIHIEANLSQVEECRRLIASAEAHYGKIDGLVNNAGIFPRGSLLETTEELFDTIFDLNMKGAFFCSRFAVEAMQRSGGGSIVHIGSTNAHRGQKDLAAYSCSEGALLTLSRHIAGHYAEDRIRSNWITVGWVATEGELKVQNMDHPALMELTKGKIPSGRMQTPEDIAYGAVYFLSDEPSQVTAAELAINGGLQI